MSGIKLLKHLIVTLGAIACFMSQSMELSKSKPEDEPVTTSSKKQPLETVTFVGKDGTITLDRNIACLSDEIAKKIQQYEINESWNGKISLPFAASELLKIKRILRLCYNEAPSVYYAAGAIVNNEKMLRALTTDIQSKKNFVIIRWLELLKPLITGIMKNNQQRNDLLHALNFFGLPLVEAIVQALREEAVHDIPYALKAFNDQRKEILSHAQHDSLLVNLKKTILQSQSVTSLINCVNLTEHTSYQQQWSPDGRHVLTASYNDHTAKIWGIHNGTWICIATLTGHTDWIDSATWSPDGTLIVTASEDNTAKIWQCINGTWTCIDTLNGHTGWVNSAAWSPDGTLIVTATHDTAKIWSIHNGSWACIARLKGHTWGIKSATWSPEGKHIVTASYHDNKAKVWGNQNGTWICIATLTGHTNTVASATWSPDGKHIVTASHDNTAKIWNVGSLIKAANYLHHLTYGELLLFKKVAIAHSNGTQYPLNSTTQKVFDCLGGDDKQIKDALQNTIESYVIKHKPTLQQAAFRNVI